MPNILNDRQMGETDFWWHVFCLNSEFSDPTSKSKQIRLRQLQSIALRKCKKKKEKKKE